MMIDPQVLRKRLEQQEAALGALKISYQDQVHQRAGTSAAIQ